MVLVKVAKAEYIDDLVNNGNLYLSLASSFRDTDHYGYDKVDTREGLVSMYDQICICSYEKIIPIDRVLEVVSNGNDCIHSFKYIDTNQGHHYIYDATGKRTKLILGDYAFFHGLIGEESLSKYKILIIKNVPDFLNRVEKAIRNLRLNAVLGKIAYDDHYFRSKYSLFSDEYAWETYFHKDRRFYTQSEYRILVQNTEKKDLVLNIGKGFFTTKNAEIHTFTPESIYVFRRPSYYK